MGGGLESTLLDRVNAATVISDINGVTDVPLRGLCATHVIPASPTSFRRKPESRGAGAARRSLQGVPDPHLTPFNSPLGNKGEGFAKDSTHAG